MTWLAQHSYLRGCYRGSIQYLRAVGSRIHAEISSVNRAQPLPEELADHTPVMTRLDTLGGEAYRRHLACLPKLNATASSSCRALWIC